MSASEQNTMQSPPPAAAPYYPPPAYPPPAQSGSQTEPRAAASLVFAILGLIFGIPLGLPGMIAGAIAYFVAKDARTRIAESGGSLAGAGAANAGRILGVVTFAVGALVTLLWLIIIFNALNDVTIGQ
jgi:hypothetical protein